MVEKTKAKIKKKKATARKQIKTAVDVNRRREWRFELPLPAEIEGQLPQGKQFREKTVLEKACYSKQYVVYHQLKLE